MSEARPEPAAAIRSPNGAIRSPNGTSLPQEQERSAVGGADAPSRRPLYRRPSALLLVAAGGTVGTAAREALTLAFPPVAGIPVIIAVINLAGAFLLGLLLETLVQRGADQGRRQRLRLLLGTGVLGGFTTYSTLATDSALLLGDAVHLTQVGPLLAVLGYALGSVLLGVVTAGLGVACGARLHRHRTPAVGEA